MIKATKTRSYPLRLPETDAQAVDRVCAESKASFNRVISLCVRKGIDQVRQALSGSGRITNVDPLPAAVAARLYAQADDDSESTRLFMAAQVKEVAE
jgi:hypothetical protein